MVSVSWVRLYCRFIAGRIKPLLVSNTDVTHQTKLYSGYVENKFQNTKDDKELVI